MQHEFFKLFLYNIHSIEIVCGRNVYFAMSSGIDHESVSVTSSYRNRSLMHTWCMRALYIELKVYIKGFLYAPQMDPCLRRNREMKLYVYLLGWHIRKE